MDFANLTNAQKLNLLRQTEYQKHVWLDREYKRILPPDIYQMAHSPLATEMDARKATQWLADHGYEIQDIHTAQDLGAVLLHHGKLVSRLVIEVAGKAVFESEGNIRSNQPLPPE